MRYSIDFEFDEDGSTILPISVGISAEDGRMLYRINKSYLYGYRRGDFHPNDWVVENVINKLTDQDVSAFGAGVFDIRKDVLNFISDYGKYTSRDQVELWGWYAAYDHVALAQLFGRMSDLPEPIPMFTNELETIRRGRALPERPAMWDEHDAMFDARYQRLILEAWSD